MENSDEEIIAKLGGTMAVAKLCGVRSQAVSSWKRSGIPTLRLLQIAVLRPDVIDLDQALQRYRVRHAATLL